jgi:hypothetical protein
MTIFESGFPQQWRLDGAADPVVAGGGLADPSGDLRWRGRLANDELDAQSGLVRVIGETKPDRCADAFGNSLHNGKTQARANLLVARMLPPWLCLASASAGVSIGRARSSGLAW